MASDNPFPQFPAQAALSREDVIAYLLLLHAQGWPVHQSGSAFIVEMKRDPHGAEKLARIVQVIAATGFRAIFLPGSG